MLFPSYQADPDPDTHLHVHLPPAGSGGPGDCVESYRCAFCTSFAGKAPKIGGGVLNPREGDYNSGQLKAGPTQPTLTTVPSIRNEMHNENSETSLLRINCGGHVASGCSRCPNLAPSKQARCLVNS